MRSTIKFWMCLLWIPLVGVGQTIAPLQTTRVGLLSVRSEPARQSEPPAGGYYVWQPCEVTAPAERIVYVDERGYTIVRILPARRETRWVRVWVPSAPVIAPGRAVAVDRPGYMHPMNTWRSRP